MMRFIAVMGLLLLTSRACADQASTTNLIPKPVQMEFAAGEFRLNFDVSVSADDPWIAQHLADELKRVTHIPIRVVAKSGTIAISTKDAPADLGQEGYELTVLPTRIVIRAPHRNGMFYCTITLQQLLHREGAEWKVPCVKIKDQPRFAWRGFMNDCSRTFIPIEELKRYIDVMAFYKLNVFHLHLTDDQGWRVEIKKYPKLTEVGATFHSMYQEPARFSGYYTQAQLKELVAYARQRGVELVPEIDLPGHCWPVLLAYPELSVSGNPQPARIFPWHMQNKEVGGHASDTLDPTNPQVYEFIGDVLDELAGIFPSRYFHMGGDEVRLSVWKNSPRLQTFIKKHDLKNERGLQAHFVRNVYQLVQNRDKVLIGWDEILYGDDLPNGVIIMAWQKTKAVDKAIAAGARTIIATNEAFYLDYWPDDRKDPALRGQGHVNTLQEMYEFDPTRSMTDPQRQLVLGMQSSMWTHCARRIDDINRLVFPRLLAIAENSWLDDKGKDFADFQQRLQAHYAHLDRFGVAYWKSDSADPPAKSLKVGGGRGQDAPAPRRPDGIGPNR